MPGAFGKNIRLTANDAIGLGVEAVELEVRRRADLIELGEKTIIMGDTIPIGVGHHEWNSTVPRSTHP